MKCLPSSPFASLRHSARYLFLSSPKMMMKLVLVAAVMAKLNVERVEYHETNGSCLGVLLHEPFWD